MRLIEKFLSETFVTVLLATFLIWFINPFGFWMTDAFHMTLLGMVVALFAVFSMFLWREKIVDEREQLLRFVATRFAYLAGGALLLIGTVVQALSHQIDPWLPLVLTGMVVAKIIGRWYAREHY